MPVPGENVQSWSKTALDNGTADALIAWPEGQTRASVNNSARGMMAALAKDRDLQNGSIITTGTVNAQEFVSGVGFTAVPTNLRVLLKIGPALTNTGPATLNMDGIGAVAIKTAAGVDVTGSQLVAGAYTEFIYNGTNWITPALPPATTLISVIEVTTVGGTASLDFTSLDSFDPSYDYFMFILKDIVVEIESTRLLAQVSEDNGATWKTGPLDYGWTVLISANNSTATISSDGDSSINITGQMNVSNLERRSLNCEFRLFRPRTTTSFKKVLYECTYHSALGILHRDAGAGSYWANTNAINGIRFKAATGNILKGSVALYGMKGSA